MSIDPEAVRRFGAAVRASLDEDATARFDEALAAMLKARFPQDPQPVLHRCWLVSAVRA